jgi:hypothetical protein
MDIGAILPYLDKIGVVALVLLLGYALATGRLVTRREADDIRQDRDTWRKTALTEQEVRVKQGVLIDEHVRTTAAAIDSIRREAERK